MKIPTWRRSPRNPKASEDFTFREHFDELKRRFFAWLGAFVLFSAASYMVRERILEVLVRPLAEPLYYSSPAGGFSFTLSLSLFLGFLLSLPLLIFEILAFAEPVAPGKTKHTAKYVIWASTVLMIWGIIFAYAVSLPAALHFLATFGGEEVRSLISASEYFTFVTRYLIGFGILFQMPLVMYYLNKIKRLDLRSLWSGERWVILLSFIVAAVLTPTPDLVNQTMMALPIIVLYQASILLIFAVNR